MKRRRVMEVFSPPVRKLWKDWEIRAMAITSLLVQIVLIFLGKRRKYISGRWIRAFVWSFYLLADSVATIALGILSNDLGQLYDDGGKPDSSNELTAFWAPFFLLHLGGPDTITAYSLEDNELYLRHLFGLLVQTIVAGYVFLMAWTGSNVSVLSIPMILVGFIKYAERTLALWKASNDELQDSMLSSPDHGPNYAKLMDEYSLRQAEGFSVDIEKVDEDNNEPKGEAAHQTLSPDKELITAYEGFEKFKRLFADLILSYQEQEESQSLFLQLEFKQAFDVIAIELGFAYDMLYTKATVIYNSWSIHLRILTFGITCAVLVIFSLGDLGKYKTVDVCITLLLLGGAIFLEICAALTLVMSDQSKLRLIEKRKEKNTCLLKVITWLELEPIKIPRWSNRIGQFSILSLFLNENPRLRWFRKYQLRPLENNRFKILERHGYRSEEKFKEGLKENIFEHVKKIYAKLRKNPGDSSHLRNLCYERGKSTIDDYMKGNKILKNSVECEYDQSILIWHIATELCCYTDENADSVDMIKKNLEMCQQISSYMLFLLAVFPYLLPAGIGLIRLRDTRAEAEKFFEERLFSSDTKKEEPLPGSDTKKNHRIKACKTLLNVKTHVPPIKVKGDRSKSVLFDGCVLAAELKKIENKQKKWEMIRDVWLDMLTFAANQCRGKEHAQQLRRGGELLTHVWLLMAHFGIIEQFQISKGHSRALLDIR